MISMDKREKVNNVYVLRKVKKHKGKIASIILLLLLILPFFTALVLFRPQGILGSFDNKLALSGPNIKIPSFQTPDFLSDTSTDYGNRNKSLINLEDNNGNGRKPDQMLDIGESASRELSLGDLKPFNTKLLIRDQKEDAIANTYHRIKSTYDITYGKITTTVFVSRNEPNLPEENAIAISYPIALRLGIIANKPTYVDVVGQLKR
jgi:hypothetical protein